jgi:hypothetical protein
MHTCVEFGLGQNSVGGLLIVKLVNLVELLVEQLSIFVELNIVYNVYQWVRVSQS